MLYKKGQPLKLLEAVQFARMFKMVKKETTPIYSSLAIKEKTTPYSENRKNTKQPILMFKRVTLWCARTLLKETLNLYT